MDTAEDETPGRDGDDDGGGDTPAEVEPVEAESVGTESVDVECLRARGHANVRSTHESTFEVTTDDWLTPAGDCILGVEADRAPADFDPGFVETCRDVAATITATLRVFPDDADEPTAVTAVRGRGHPDLTFESDRGAVCRTADYVDDRTVMVNADRAAADLDREVVAALSKPETDLLVELSVDPP
ncbi:DUF371 domain-containing protein [Halobacteriales archaeon SW_7_71_33]|nr:MAG: DUF371 domain-containing protein [Halobacteriales archaeon SW_7_71_33]